MKELRKTEGEKTKGKIEGRAMGEGEERVGGERMMAFYLL